MGGAIATVAPLEDRRIRRRGSGRRQREVRLGHGERGFVDAEALRLRAVPLVRLDHVLLAAHVDVVELTAMGGAPGDVGGVTGPGARGGAGGKGREDERR